MKKANPRIGRAAFLLLLLPLMGCITGMEALSTETEPPVASAVPSKTATPLARIVPATGSASLREADMVPPSAPSARADVVSSDWIEIVLPEIEYDAKAVSVPGNYSITSADDPDFAGPQQPILVQHRHWPEYAPYTDVQSEPVARIQVVYRIYLHLARKLKEGKSYRVTVGSAVIQDGLSFNLPFDLEVANDAIHVNQVAYRSEGPKIAYLSAWTGEGTVDFGGAAAFMLIDEATNAAVFSGPVHFDMSGEDEEWSHSNVYSLDFSAFTASGRYHLYLPGVGVSYSFDISPAAFGEIGYTVIRGLTAQRDGNHGLDDPAVTHWTRPPAHLDDAIDQKTGKRVDLVGGHMDAGDRGKYPYHTADTVVSLLSAVRLFPDQVLAMGESLQIPESGNGIPDILDELLYETDYLYKTAVNTGLGGLQAFYLRPQMEGSTGYGAEGGYEMWAPLEGYPDRMYFDGGKLAPKRAETLYAAGALAMAYNTPLLCRYVPEKCGQYRDAAVRVYDAYESYVRSGGRWAPDGDDTGWYDGWTDEGPHPWSDEMLVAAANLYEATGDEKYNRALQPELPSDLTKTRRYGWDHEGPWLAAFLSIYQSTRLPDSLRGRAKAAIVNWADSVWCNPDIPDDVNHQPFGMPLIRDVYGRVGWYFSGSQIGFPLMMGYGVTGEAKYRDGLIRMWNYLLGSNPLSRTFVTGLGDPERRPRWMVHELSLNEWILYRSSGGAAGWCEPPPGLLSADIQQGEYEYYLDDEWNTPRMDEKYPAPENYPALYRYHDSWTTVDEFTINVMARGAASLIPLV
jgi:hypothetical protein